MATPQAEEANFANKLSSVRQFISSPRFRYTKRLYTAEDVASLRGTITPSPLSNYTAKKLYGLLRESFNNGKYLHTFGSLDPVQTVQMSKYLQCIYVSGWQCSSTASTTNDPGPDFADYPSNTVSNKVEHLFKAQLFHDRKQCEARSRMSLEEKSKNKKIDYLRPIIADGDCGFGGVTAVMKLMKLMIEAGAAGVHIEDQKAGAKKCGHLGGKVLVSMREHVNRLSAFRLQADIMNTETVIIARTDSVSAIYLDNNIDYRDHPYIAGVCDKNLISYADAINKEEWLNKAGLCRYPDCIANQMKKDGKLGLANEFLQKAYKLSNSDARQLAKSYGYGNVFWCWEKARSNEGYYRIVGGTDYAIARAIVFAPFADLVWMETPKPDLKQCIQFSRGVHNVFPHQMLAYNLSPSFNWDIINDDDTREFQDKVGKLGFAWHFITLAGFHLNALATDEFAREYGKNGVIKYVEMIQRREREKGVETLTHQKWSGTELKDKELTVATGGTSSTAAGKHSTEDQFGARSKL